MKNDDKIFIPNERSKDMVAAIKIYFSQREEEEIGDLRAILILDFIIEKLAPDFYNQGVCDSYQYMNDMLEDVLSIQK